MFEKIIFFVLAFAMLIIMLLRFSNRKNTLYIGLIALEIISILTRFILVTNGAAFNFVVISILYVLAIIIPVVIFLSEKKGFYITEQLVVIEAKLLSKYGNNSKARRKLINYIGKYPNSYYAHRLLGQIYELDGRDDEAIDEYICSVDLNPKDYDSYYEIAFLLNKNEKSNESEKMLLQLLEKKPEYYKASELLGTILYDQEKFKEAIAVYNKALKYNPTRYELYYGLGMNYTRLNDFQVARECYEKAAAINSMLYHAKFNIAQIALITGELDEAEARFIDCMDDKDSEPEAYYYLAIICLHKGEEDKAIGYMNIAVELDSRIYKKAMKLDVFKGIMKQIKSPKEHKRAYHLTYEEVKTRKHLDNTLNLIDSMKDSSSKYGGSDLRIKQKDIEEKLIR